MSWFKRSAPPKVKQNKKASVPEGIWRLCDACGTTSLAEEVERCLETCPSCSKHFRARARQHISWLLDGGQFTEHEIDLESADPLEFTDSKKYPDRLERAQKNSGERDAFVLVDGVLGGIPVVVGSFEFKFLGGSMGSVVGEKITRAFEIACERKCPVVIFSASGGARMQEGILSLMQMAKTSAAIARYRAVGLPYISVLTDPTTGGVAASFAMLGDIIVAEPGALIGFAGPRVIEQTIRERLPEGFQRSEFLLEHGAVDMIVPRTELRGRLAGLLSMLCHRGETLGSEWVPQTTH